MVSIRLDGVGRRFGNTVALDDVSLDFPAGSFTSLLGPSGCGKTTMLRLIAGFETPDTGHVSFDGRIIAEPSGSVPPERRGVGVVFQSYALWPHMDVARNVGYPLTTRGRPPRDIEMRVREALASVGLDGYQARRIDELSGGQRQRVALARCLIADSKIILFDEPLANLDMHLRASMVDIFRDIHRRSGATMIYVTHDQAEALALSDRIAVMDGGRVLQVAAPAAIYRSPAHSKIAGFVGRGIVLNATALDQRPDTALLDLAGYQFVARTSGIAPSAKVRVLLRPEGLNLAECGLSARVIASIYRGPVHEVHARLAVTQDIVVLDCVNPPQVNEIVHVVIADAWVIPNW